MFWLMNTDYRKMRQPRVIFTALSVTLLLLVAVFFLDRSHATHRWIRLGPASFQPSELAKLVVIFYLAWFLEIRRKPRNFGVNDPMHSLLPALGTVLVMVALVLAEPDMGTACMIFMIAFVMLYVSGLSLRYMFATGLAAKVDDVRDVNAVAANRKRIEPVGEPVSHLKKHALYGQGQIKRRLAYGIEAPSLQFRSFTR